jgi:xanthine dehydrogenase accessory factor
VKYELSDDFAEESGLICGGQMEVFIEPMEPSPDLYVFGAGHVGHSLTRMAHDAGFHVHLIDDREKFADAALFPAGVDVVVEDIPGWLGSHEMPQTGYAVVVTRGHRHDLDALRALVLRRSGTLGSLGAARRSSGSTTRFSRKAWMPRRSSACMRRSASTSELSRRRRSRSASSPS